MKSTLLLTRIWLRTAIIYTLIRFPQKSYFKTKVPRRVLLNKKTLKQLKPESLNLSAGVKTYINESVCPYYKKLWAKCKQIWDANRILSLWVSNRATRVNLDNENVSIITHDCDLEKLFPSDPLISDTY